MAPSAKQTQQKDFLEHFILQSLHIAMVDWTVKSTWNALTRIKSHNHFSCVTL